MTKRYDFSILRDNILELKMPSSFSSESSADTLICPKCGSYIISVGSPIMSTIAFKNDLMGIPVRCMQDHESFLNLALVPNKGLRGKPVLRLYLQQTTEIDYQEYIQSPEWRQKAKEAKERAGYRCQLCNKPGDDKCLHAHHRTYERLGDELPEDITVLCDVDHAKFHDKTPS